MISLGPWIWLCLGLSWTKMSTKGAIGKRRPRGVSRGGTFFGRFLKPHFESNLGAKWEGGFDIPPSRTLPSSTLPEGNPVQKKNLKC